MANVADGYDFTFEIWLFPQVGAGFAISRMRGRKEA